MMRSFTEDQVIFRDSYRKFLASEIAPHMVKEQIRFSSPVIERAPLGRWREEGETTLGERAAREVERWIGAWTPSRLPDETKRALRERIAHAARSAGMEELPLVSEC